MTRFRFEAATPAHDADLRRLMAENAMEGEIALSFRREPSYFHGTAVQGTFAQVVAARDTRSNELVGVATRAARPGYVNGTLTTVGFLADMRLDPRYRGGLLVGRAFRHLARLHEDGRANLYFTVIAEANRRALATIASGRAGLPPYRDLGRPLSPAVNLLRPRRAHGAGCAIARGTPDQLPEIVACLNRHHQRRQFAPHHTVDQFSPPGATEEVVGPARGAGDPCSATASADQQSGRPTRSSLRGFQVHDFYVARRAGRVVGVLGKWDQGEFKQTVVTAYRGRLRWLRPLYNLGAGLVGCARYPPPGEALRSFYASFIAVDEDDVDVFRALLRQLYNDHAGSRYHYFLVGLHERDPLAAALSDFTLTPFNARLFAVHFADGQSLFQNLDSRPPYVELAML